MNNLPEGIDRMEYEAPTYRPIEKYRWTGNMEFRPYSVSTNRSRQVWTDQFKYDSQPYAGGLEEVGNNETLRKSQTPKLFRPNMRANVWERTVKCNNESNRMALSSKFSKSLSKISAAGQDRTYIKSYENTILRKSKKV